jgi:hypothetical protein
MRGWTFTTPYTITLASETHTLSGDSFQHIEVHPVCLDAHSAGDTTFGVQQGVVFRFLRGKETDASIRGSEGHSVGVGVPCWNAGRSEFEKHRNEDVPSIKASSVTREPYAFSLDLSSVLPHADEYPLEFAFTNFIYWHTRRDDVVLVIRDNENLFGTTALYCGRRIVIMEYENAEVLQGKSDSGFANASTKKAYDTMSFMMSGDTFFNQYPTGAKFATISRLVRNTRNSLVDGPGILHSQTISDTKRFKRSESFERADLITPCRLVLTRTCTLALSHANYYSRSIHCLPGCLLVGG